MKAFERVFVLLVVLVFCSVLGSFHAGASSVIDYRKVMSFEKAEDYTGYLEDILLEMEGSSGGFATSNSMKAELVLYVETAVSSLASAPMTAVGNQLVVTGDSIKAGILEAESALGELESLLSEYNVTVNKDIAITFRIEGSGFNLLQPCQVTFTEDMLESMRSAQSVQILLGDNQHSISVACDGLRDIFGEAPELVVQVVRKSPGEYGINFIAEDGSVSDKISSAVSFTLPAESEFATVLANYSEGSDNWGGQFDRTNSAIEFSTGYSGVYEVLKNKVTISDIGILSDNDRNIITFMVSKGYFNLKDGAFEPDSSLTRYDFTSALVGMFFALDRGAESSFTDVSKDSGYYAHVSSAEEDGIIQGYGDGEFKGESNIAVQEMVALCARTLADKKGYNYPDDPENYLTFTDSRDIAGWARAEVALAVREGLIPADGALTPSGAVSRSDSARILYNLFMLLYETSPVSFEFTPAAELVTIAPIDGGFSDNSDESGFTLRSVLNTLIQVLVVLAVIAFVVVLYIMLRGKTRLRR